MTNDILVFSKNIQEHFDHLHTFEKIIINNGLVRFLGHNIEKGQVIPIQRSIDFAAKFPDEIEDKTQLQRFLGSLNYISPFYKDLSTDSAILYDRLKKNPGAWTNNHTQAVKRIKDKVKNLPCLSLANPNWEKIIETDASKIGFGGILKQIHPNNKHEFLVRFHSGKWTPSQKNYSTTAKEILALIVRQLNSCLIKTSNMMFLNKCLPDGKLH
uniref:Reverse transcriptase/retrotransposon-derived protein RNase H-like domain-containing protein n=1 Tax=Lactuca sativa TaxID=4236 RepID=A0A9R1VNQ5_LACSA|nr:hypothetical protein LSAT_V11C500230730 [Lactuca sativa]